MKMLQAIKTDILAGGVIDKTQALVLLTVSLDELCAAANEIREFFCGNTFDICTIINGKSGRCSENCKYCAQSSFYQTDIAEYPLLNTDEIITQAKYNEERGVLRYSIVTSGKALDNQELEKVCESIRKIKSQAKISVCTSFGLLDETQFKKLKSAGVDRIHNNLETSRDHFPNVCTSHTYEDKISAIRAAQKAELDICSGGIMGLGESVEDRIDMAFTFRELGINSIPINMLNPIPGTPYENSKLLTHDEICRIVAIFRFVLPKSTIRLAGGRGLLCDKGRKCFCSGANAAITGDMLTTAGVSIQDDMKMIEELGYKVALRNE